MGKRGFNLLLCFMVFPFLLFATLVPPPPMFSEEGMLINSIFLLSTSSVKATIASSPPNRPRQTGELELPSVCGFRVSPRPEEAMI